MNMVMQRNRGFSLLEIMVVVAILGLLAGIAVPIYNNYTQSARATECANEVSAIQLAEEEFFLVNNTYFSGANVAAIAAASAGVYIPNPVVLTTASVCTYTVTPGGGGIATQYAINAIPSATGPLAGTNLNMNTCNYTPCP